MIGIKNGLTRLELWRNTLILVCLLTPTLIIAQTSSDKASLDRILKSYFENYGVGLSGFPVRSTLESCVVNSDSKHLTITADTKFSEQEFTPEVVKKIYQQIESRLPNAYRDYKITVRSHGQSIDDLIPSRLNSHPDKSRTWQGLEYEGRPWVTNLSRPNEITRGLQGRHLSIAASHGRYYDTSKGAWKWQRPNLFCTTEDLFTQTIVVPYLMPMLENAGAVVWSPRERDWQRNEVIVDNDNNSSHYTETVGSSQWSTAPGSGFANIARLTSHENPFKSGTARMALASSKKNISQAQYLPNIPEAGKYAVYVSYQTLENSIDDAQYTVIHKGQQTTFSVNQQMGGGTWVYLGTFDFDKGCNRRNMVVLTNYSKHHGVVTADAVRFGGGMGNVERGGRTSGMPRCLEGTRYSAQWGGAPDSVYCRYHEDYKDDYTARTFYGTWLAGGSTYAPTYRGLGVPLELVLSVHSDAGYDKAGGNDLVGTLSICSTDYTKGKLNGGISRWASYDLADALLYNAYADLQGKFGNWKRRVLYNRNYSETREPLVPSAILETMSHQNFGDMRFGLDPNFRFYLARSIYKTLLREICFTHGTKYTVQPLAPRNFRIEISSRDKLKLSWNPVKDPQEPSATPSEYILYTATNNNGFDNGIVIKNNSCTVNAQPGVLYHFKVTACNRGGESFPTEVLSACIQPNAKKTVMIVNGFHRLSSPAVVDNGSQKGFDLDDDIGVTYGRTCGWSGRQTVFDNSRRGREGPGALGYCSEELIGRFIAGNDFDYIITHAEAINSRKKYNIISCSSEALESGKMKTHGIDCIDLLLGLEKDDGHSLLMYKTFSNDMQKRLRSYVSNHGSLLVSGSFVSSDMSSPSEQQFLADVLKLRPGGTERGNTNGMIDGLGLKFDTYRTLNEVHYAATAPDVLQHLSTSSCVMRYSDGRDAAVAYSGRDYRCLTMGFPFECIKDASQRNAIMSGIMNYLLNK